MKRSLGFSLLEISLVLVVIAALLISTMQLYRVVERHRRVAEAANMILTVYQAGAQLQRLEQHKDLLRYLVDSGFLDKSYLGVNASPWGTALEAWSTRPELGKSSIVTISMFEIPDDACNDLKNKFKNKNFVISIACQPTEFNSRVSNFSMEALYEATQ